MHKSKFQSLNIFLAAAKVVFVLTFLVLPEMSFAAGRVTGLLEWDFAHYEADLAGARYVDADSVYQGYFLSYENKGLLYEGRGGKYDFTLGADWVSVDADIDRAGTVSKIDTENSKLIYRGDVLIAPGGLPFRLHLFSHDLSRSFPEPANFLSDGNFAFDRISRPKPNILSPFIVNDVADGTRVSSGASLTLGIRNGSYLGKYREIFSHFPKLFIDYKEDYVKDVESITPEHYIDKELAFVSLNKKHNWFHYRFFEHINKLSPLSNYEDRLMMIGTVDQYYNREWVNLTNWIQISTDASYLIEENPNNSVGVERTYALNLFSKAERRNVRGSVMSRFVREEQINRLSRRAVVPFSITGDIDRQTSWSARVIGLTRKEYNPFAIVYSETRDDAAYTELKFSLNQHRPVIYKPRLRLEVDRKDDGDGFAGTVGLTLFSNRNMGGKTAFNNDVFLNVFKGELRNRTTGAVLRTTDFWEINNLLSVNREYSARLKAGVDFDLTYGAGDLNYEFTKYIREESLAVMESSDPKSFTTVEDDVLRVKLQVSGQYLANSRIANNLSLRTEVVDTGSKTTSQVSLEHGLQYRNNGYRYEMKNELNYGDRLSSGVSSEGFNVVFPLRDYSGTGFSHMSSLGYRPNREWNFRGILDLTWLSPENDGGGLYYHFVQEASYTHHKRVGLRRKLWTVSQVFEYESFDAKVGEDGAVGLLMLDTRLYPNTWSNLGARFRMQSDYETGTDETGFGLYAGLDFSKLDVTAEYETGMRTKDDTGAILERDEQRWKLNVKKTF